MHACRGLLLLHGHNTNTRARDRWRACPHACLSLQPHATPCLASVLQSVAEHYGRADACLRASVVQTRALMPSRTCTAAATCRNLCIQRAEYMRKCDEDVDKKYVECMTRASADTGRCGAQNATVMSFCVAKEWPKHVGCKVRRGAAKAHSCAVSDTTAVYHMRSRGLEEVAWQAGRPKESLSHRRTWALIRPQIPRSRTATLSGNAAGFGAKLPCCVPSWPCVHRPLPALHKPLRSP